MFEWRKVTNSTCDHVGRAGIFIGEMGFKGMGRGVRGLDILASLILNTQLPFFFVSWL